MSKSNKEENFQKGILLCKFLRENEPKEPFFIEKTETFKGFLVADWKSFVNSHCGVLENRNQFNINYQIWKTWYMRAYQAKKHIEDEQET